MGERPLGRDGWLAPLRVWSRQPGTGQTRGPLHRYRPRRGTLATVVAGARDRCGRRHAPPSSRRSAAACPWAMTAPSATAGEHQRLAARLCPALTGLDHRRTWHDPPRLLSDSCATYVAGAQRAAKRAIHRVASGRWRWAPVCCGKPGAGRRDRPAGARCFIADAGYRSIRITPATASALPVTKARRHSGTAICWRPAW